MKSEEQIDKLITELEIELTDKHITKVKSIQNMIAINTLKSCIGKSREELEKMMNFPYASDTSITAINWIIHG